MQLLHFIHVHNNFPSFSQHLTRCIFCNSNIALAWENSRYLAIPPLHGFPAKWRLGNERRNSILSLMTCHYPDLDTASDWSCRWWNLLQPIRSITQIWVVTRRQYGISALVSQMSFRGETVRGIAKYRHFSQADITPFEIIVHWFPTKNGFLLS